MLGFGRTPPGYRLIDPPQSICVTRIRVEGEQRHRLSIGASLCSAYTGLHAVYGARDESVRIKPFASTDNDHLLTSPLKRGGDEQLSPLDNAFYSGVIVSHLYFCFSQSSLFLSTSAAERLTSYDI